MRLGRDTRRWGGLVILSMFASGIARGDLRLVPGVATEAEVGPGEVRVLLLDADEGSAVHFRVDHQHLDLVFGDGARRREAGRGLTHGHT